jgi:hypothetical protein
MRMQKLRSRRNSENVGGRVTGCCSSAWLGGVAVIAGAYRETLKQYEGSEDRRHKRGQQARKAAPMMEMAVWMV